MKPFVVAVLLVLCVGWAWAGPPGMQAFSADISMQSHGETMTGKWFFEPDKTRMEMVARGHDVVNIMRMDRKVAYMVMAERHMFMETPLEGNRAAAASTSGRSDAQFALVGAEVVNGQLCDKYSVTVDGKVTSYQWRATGQLLPVRDAAVDGSWQIDFTNVHMGPQDPALFEPPANFQRLDFHSMPTP